MSVDELLMGVCTMIGVHRYKIWLVSIQITLD